MYFIFWTKNRIYYMPRRNPELHQIKIAKLDEGPYMAMNVRKFEFKVDEGFWSYGTLALNS